jgi:hypothetical protein
MGNGYISYKRRQRADRHREPVVEGLLELDLLQRRPAARLSPGDLRAPGLRLRRQAAWRPARTGWSGRTGVRRPARAGGRGPQAALQPRLLAGRSAGTSRSRSIATAARSTRSRRTTAILLWSGIVDTAKAKSVVDH